LCEDCRCRIRDDQAVRCGQCGARFPGIGTAGGRLLACRLCRDLKLPIAGVHCLGNYEGLLRQVVLMMKKRGNEALAIQSGRWLGQSWYETFSPEDPIPERIVSIPVWWARRLRRGYNVPELLLEGMLAGLPFRPRATAALRCVRRTRKQGTLTTRQRFENVKGCFAARHSHRIAGRHVLLVDDVMTSGATAIQAARTLLKAGARSVRVACVARGTGHRG
jgi:ComF family protein